MKTQQEFKKRQKSIPFGKRTIYRTTRKKGTYAIVNKDIFSAGLSLDTIAILCYMLTKPDDWEFIGRNVIKELDTNRYRYNKAIKELQEKGYLSIYKHRKPDSSWGTQYRVYEDPSLNTKYIHSQGFQSIITEESDKDDDKDSDDK